MVSQNKTDNKICTIPVREEIVRWTASLGAVTGGALWPDQLEDKRSISPSPGFRWQPSVRMACAAQSAADWNRSLLYTATTPAGLQSRSEQHGLEVLSA